MVYVSVILSAIAALGVIGAAMWFIFSLSSRVKTIDRSVRALVLIHPEELTNFYKDNVASLYNPHQPLDRDILISKLEMGVALTPAEAHRLEEILKWEEAEAIRKNQQKALLAVGGMLLLLYILTKK